MEEKQEDRSKQAHIKHTKDKGSNIVLRRTKGKKAASSVYSVIPVVTLCKQPQKWVGVGVGVLGEIWPQDFHPYHHWT